MVRIRFPPARSLLQPDPLDQGAELQLAGHRMPGSHSCTRLFAPL
jgi:hypothetical protein